MRDQNLYNPLLHAYGGDATQKRGSANHSATGDAGRDRDVGPIGHGAEDFIYLRGPSVASRRSSPEHRHCVRS